MAKSAAAEQNNGEAKKNPTLKDHAVTIVGAILMALLIKYVLFEIFVIPSGSMEPTLHGRPDGGDRVKPYTLISFGGGKHVCIGMHFAYLQVKLIWTLLLSRFAFAPAAPLPRSDYGSWVTGPVPPARVRYRRRSVPVGPSC